MSGRPVVVFVAGDVMLGRGVVRDLQRGETPLQWLTTQSQAADIAFCNLECVLSAAPDTMAARSRPFEHRLRLFVPPATVRYLNTAGVDIVSVANNHTLDGGEAGVASTLSTLHQAGIAGIGAASGDAPWRAWEATVGGRRVAWVAASAYGPWHAGRAHIRNIAGTGLPEQVRALSQAGDVVFVSLHWGNELSRCPTAGQVQVAHALIDAGATAIVGHHPHVAQPVEVYRGRPIFYSLGNFVFDRVPGRTQDGFAAYISVLPSGSVQFRILPLRPPEKERRTRQTAQPIALPLPTGETLVRALPGRFLPPGRGGQAGRQVVVWSRHRDGEAVLRAFVRSAHGWHCLAEGHHPDIFDLQVGDIDSDGRDEVVLGLMQRSKLDVRIARRLYVYSVGPDGAFTPRWRGSGLSRPFDLFRLLPARRGCDLVALEKDGLPGDREFEWLSVYHWNGFGLRRLWDTPVRGSVQDLRTGLDGQGPFVMFVQNERGGRRTLILRPQGGPSDRITFKARLVDNNTQNKINDDIDPPPRGGKATGIHEGQTHALLR